VKRFPHELEAMLSTRGRRVQAGKDRALNGGLGREGVLFASGLFDAKLSRQVPALLDRTFAGLLEEFADPAPPAAYASLFNSQERLPRVGRGRSLEFGPLVESRGSVRAAEIGLTQLLASEGFRRFAEVLAGASLTGPSSMKALLQRAGDYSGPSTGHLPEEANARGGFVALELSFGTEGITRQFSVHERDGHLNAIHRVDVHGGLTAWRLPRWHYTTPLEVKRAAARRWNLSHTYYYVRAERAETPDAPSGELRN